MPAFSNGPKKHKHLGGRADRPLFRDALRTNFWSNVDGSQPDVDGSRIASLVLVTQHVGKSGRSTQDLRFPYWVVPVRMLGAY